MRRQRTLDFGPSRRWADIVAQNPQLYRGLLYELALRKLHRDGQPHAAANCPLCHPEKPA